MLGSNGGAECGHCIIHTILSRGDHIHIAFHDHSEVMLANSTLGQIQRRLGVFEERIETIRKLIELDPLNTGRPIFLVWNLVVTHQYDAAQAEIDATDGESYGLAAWKSLLDLRHDRDIGRWFAEMQTLHERYEEDDPLYL